MKGNRNGTATTKKRLNAVAWYGGKSFMLKKLLPIIEACEHRIYVEAFGGGGVVLLNKRPSPVEVYNDIDSGLVNFFKVLSDPKLFRQFYRRVALLPYSRQLYREALAAWESQKDSIQRAALWFVVARQSFSGKFGKGWSYSIRSSARSTTTDVSTWLSGISKLPEIHARLQRVQIENLDWRECLQKYDTPETLWYLDPPYVPATRKATKVYRHEMSLEEHIELIDAVQQLAGCVVLSGYAHEAYKPLDDAGWKRKDWKVTAAAIGKTRLTGLLGTGALKAIGARTECVWLNPRACEQCKSLLL